MVFDDPLSKKCLAFDPDWPPNIWIEQEIPDDIFTDERDLGSDGQLNSKEELMYYRIFKNLFGDAIPLSEVGRTQYI